MKQPTFYKSCTVSCSHGIICRAARQISKSNSPINNSAPFFSGVSRALPPCSFPEFRESSPRPKRRRGAPARSPIANNRYCSTDRRREEASMCRCITIRGISLERPRGQQTDMLIASVGLINLPSQMCTTSSPLYFQLMIARFVTSVARTGCSIKPRTRGCIIDLFTRRNANPRGKSKWPVISSRVIVNEIYFYWPVV